MQAFIEEEVRRYLEEDEKKKNAPKKGGAWNWLKKKAKAVSNYVFGGRGETEDSPDPTPNPSPSPPVNQKL